jgi:hypothetical protein
MKKLGIGELISLAKITEKMPKGAIQWGGYLKEGREWITTEPGYLAVAVLVKKEWIQQLQGPLRNELPEALRPLILDVDLGQNSDQSTRTNPNQLDIEKDLLKPESPDLVGK